MAKMITLTIDPVTGEVELDLAGWKGKGCHAVQEKFTEDTGSTTLAETKKPEYNAPVSTKRCITR